MCEEGGKKHENFLVASCAILSSFGSTTDTFCVSCLLLYLNCIGELYLVSWNCFFLKWLWKYNNVINTEATSAESTTYYLNMKQVSLPHLYCALNIMIIAVVYQVWHLSRKIMSYSVLALLWIQKLCSSCMISACF